MKGQHKVSIAILISTLVLASCSGAGKAVEQGDEARTAGNNYLAARYYLNALDKKDGYADAIRGLEQTAELGYEERIEIAEGYQAQGDHDRSIEEYEEVGRYLDRLRGHDVLFFVPVNISQRINAASATAANEFYEAAEDLFSQRQFRRAIESYEEALSLTTPYRDARQRIGEAYFELADAAVASRQYRQGAANYLSSDENASSSLARERAAAIYHALGIHYLDQGRCRNANEDLNRSWELGHSESSVNQEISRARDCAMTGIAFVEIENLTGRTIAGMSLSDFIFENIKGKTQNKASEFVRLLDRQQLRLLMTEQGISEGNINNLSSLPGNIQGVDYFVVGKLNQVNVEEENPNSRRVRDTYEYRAEQRYVDDDGDVKTRSTWVPAEMTYDVTEASVNVRLSGAVNVVSSQTSEIIIAQPIDLQANDEVRFADRFAMQHNPDNRSVEISQRAERLRNARRNLSAPDELIRPLIDSFAESVASRVVQELDQVPAPVDPRALELSFQVGADEDQATGLPSDIEMSGEAISPSNAAAVRQVQNWLNQLGYSCGPADGLMGDNTRDCIEAFQEASNLPVSGSADEATMSAIREAVR